MAFFVLIELTIFKRNASLSYKLVEHTRFECLRERTLSLLEVLINIDFLNKVCFKIYKHY